MPRIDEETADPENDGQGDGGQMPVISAHRNLRQEDCLKFKATLGFMGDPVSIHAHQTISMNCQQRRAHQVFLLTMLQAVAMKCATRQSERN